jgi:hypothetical protein
VEKSPFWCGKATSWVDKPGRAWPAMCSTRERIWEEPSSSALTFRPINFSRCGARITLYSDQDADRVFAPLSDGGEIFMPTQDPPKSAPVALLLG